MPLPDRDSFPPEVVKKLKAYVYRLIDPRNGETFYIGKGQGNRVFAHIRTEQHSAGDDLTEKIKRIREIKRAGFHVAHVIHRHGMDDPTALAVESALIDAYPGLTNISQGIGASALGSMHAKEIIRKYSAEQAKFKHKALLICISRTSDERSYYDATRYAWKISKTRANAAQVILATVRGVIVDAFVAHDWLPATPENFPELAAGEGRPGRLGFKGKRAPKAIRDLYIGKRVPDEFTKRGAANPIKYTWK
jgi:uncharacterized protein